MTLDNTSVQKFGGFQRDGGNGFKDATDAFGVKISIIKVISYEFKSYYL